VQVLMLLGAARAVARAGHDKTQPEDTTWFTLVADHGELQFVLQCDARRIQREAHDGRTNALVSWYYTKLWPRRAPQKKSSATRRVVVADLMRLAEHVHEAFLEDEDDFAEPKARALRSIGDVHDQIEALVSQKKRPRMERE
jgi:hypothetical protein